MEWQIIHPCFHKSSLKKHHTALKFSTLYWIMQSLIMCSSHFDSSSLAGESDLPRFCLFSEASLGMSQESCGVTWKKDSVVDSRIILSIKGLWNLFYQELSRDTADLKCFLLASQPSSHLDLAFLSCKPSYLSVFSAQSPSPFFCADWGPGPHKAPAAWGGWQDSDSCGLSIPWERGLIRLPSIKCRKHPTPSTCWNFSQQFPKLCEGQNLISSYSIFPWFWSVSVFSYLFLYHVQL